jgi:hypothetical protein
MGDKVRAPASSPPPPRHPLLHRLQPSHVHTSFANRGAGGLGRRWCAGDGAAGRERVARNASGGARGGSCRLSTRVGSSGVFAALRQPGSFCARGGSCARGRGALPVAARWRGGKPKHAHLPARRACPAHPLPFVYSSRAPSTQQPASRSSWRSSRLLFVRRAGEYWAGRDLLGKGSVAACKRTCKCKGTLREHPGRTGIVDWHLRSLGRPDGLFLRRDQPVPVGGGAAAVPQRGG